MSAKWHPLLRMYESSLGPSARIAIFHRHRDCIVQQLPSRFLRHIKTAQLAVLPGLYNMRLVFIAGVWSNVFPHRCSYYRSYDAAVFAECKQCLDIGEGWYRNGTNVGNGMQVDNVKCRDPTRMMLLQPISYRAQHIYVQFVAGVEAWRINKNDMFPVTYTFVCLDTRCACRQSMTNL